MQLLRAGSDPELPFSPIVASGPNSALPHAVPGDRELSAGDLLILDWGATSRGYISDLTRTLAMGEIEAELARIHEIVQQSNAAGRWAVMPEGTCGGVDQAARAVIAASGYGEFFIHRTGHGIGLEAHEPPYIRGDSAERLAPGMVFTVEPGIYLPGRGGVRVEDNVLVTAEGGESLTTFPRDLRVVG
jgi:Xaa-Pro dipeptidase